MKEFFLVNNEIENMRKDGKWVDVSLDAIKNSAKINVPSVKLFASRKDAERAALDGADLQKDTGFFSVIRVEVPNHLKGRKSVFKLDDGTKLSAVSFAKEHVKATDVYLSHIDKSYADVSLSKASKHVKDAKNEAKPSAKSATVDRFARVRGIGRYLPSVKNTLKNGIPLAAGVAAWYFGNAEVAAFVAKSTFSLPEAIATHSWLPAIAGTTLRVAAEVPELVVKAPGFALKVGKGVASLCGAGLSKLSRKKAGAAATTPTVKPELTDALAGHLAGNSGTKMGSDAAVSKAVTHAKDHKSESASPLRELIPQKAPTPTAEKPTLH